MDKENTPSSSRAHQALSLGPRARNSKSHPLSSFGRHVGRSVWAFCSVKTLFSDGVERMAAEQSDESPPELSPEKRRAYLIFKEILRLRPSLFNTLFTGDSSVDDLITTAQYIQDGINGARSDDLKGLKGAVVDWLAPPGQYLNPMIRRNDKTVRGFNHEATGRLLCPADMNWDDPNVKESLKSGSVVPAGDQWPVLLYKDHKYDPEDPWKGLLRSDILVKAYRHVFTSPSSVEKEQSCATRMGNAQLHGMDTVTRASIAYIATLLRFSICSAAVFSRTDSITDSEFFYYSIMDLLEDPDEEEEVKALLLFWNQSIFPRSSAKKRMSEESALSRIRKKRRALKEANLNASSAAAGSSTGVPSAGSSTGSS